MPQTWLRGFGGSIRPEPAGLAASDRPEVGAPTKQSAAPFSRGGEPPPAAPCAGPPPLIPNSPPYCRATPIAGLPCNRTSPAPVGLDGLFPCNRTSPALPGLTASSLATGPPPRCRSGDLAAIGAQSAPCRRLQTPPQPLRNQSAAGAGINPPGWATATRSCSRPDPRRRPGCSSHASSARLHAPPCRRQP